ncbi:aldose epimerase family protein [Bacillus gaemokensis]|uniref:Aldose 1-epimerase n=1 Tax=Bacillus gaemokensis TaxID=574375 RepID=A0A073K946_9BACI|nr:aldose epimerase family protein [Bacillus gaemokensis]KEK22947.1 aldose epimerase [Bacillus gaemokensis]KYG37497.1 galactose mutarotase [Bacillus gaemokensis]
MNVFQKKFGEIDGNHVYAYTFTNHDGLEITCINYGCIITKVIMPDRYGNFENIVLGYEDMASYSVDSSYLGAVVGRVAGRIKDAKVELEGTTYDLDKNENGHHLHGGVKSFSHIIWDATMIKNKKELGVRFSYMSPAGEGGYPGNVHVTVTYTLNDKNEFCIQYDAETDQTTLLNVTNHTYFNLSGNAKRNILNHMIKMNSDRFIELNEQFLPTGNLVDVRGTAFDLREGRLIKDGIQSNNSQIKRVGQGYDHSFVLNRPNNGEILLWEEESGRNVVIKTSEASVVFYTGNQLFNKYTGLCLETQKSPNLSDSLEFPSYILKKGQHFSSITKYTFGLK